MLSLRNLVVALALVACASALDSKHHQTPKEKCEAQTAKTQQGGIEKGVWDAAKSVCKLVTIDAEHDTTKKGNAVTKKDIADASMKVKGSTAIQTGGNGARQEEAGNDLVAKSKDMAKSFNKDNIMKRIQARAAKMKKDDPTKADKMSEWASRKTSITSAISTTTSTETKVEVKDNAINEKAFALEATTTFKNNYEKNKEGKPTDADFRRMSVSMRRKVGDLTTMTGMITAFSNNFFPKIIEMVAKVKAQKKHLEEQAKRAKGATSKTKKVESVQVIDEKLLSEDRLQLELLIQTQRDLSASAKVGSTQLAEVQVEWVKEYKEMMPKIGTFHSQCLKANEDWYEEFASEYTAVEEYVKKCKPEDPFFLPEINLSDLGIVANSVEEVKTASTESASDTKTLEASAKLPSANSIESAVPGGNPESVMMFKSGENKGTALMARILRDKEQITRDQAEVRKLDFIATAPVTAALRGTKTEVAFIEGDDINKVTRTKAETGFAGGFVKKDNMRKDVEGSGDGKNVRSATRSDRAGSNEVANKIFDKNKDVAKAGEVGDKTGVTDVTTASDLESPTADFSHIPSIPDLLAAAEDEFKRTPASTEKLAKISAKLAQWHPDNLWDSVGQGDMYVNGVLTGAQPKPDAKTIVGIASGHAHVKDVDEAVRIVDERLVWLREAMKEMAKYYIWARAEVKRGVTVQKITNVKAYKEVLAKLQHDKQETALDAEDLISTMVRAYQEVTVNIQTSMALIKNSRAIIAQGEGLIVKVEQMFGSTTTSCKTFLKTTYTEMKAGIEKKCAAKDSQKRKAIELLNLVKARCSTNVPNNKCLTEFKTWYNGATGKELLLKTFRKIFAVYTAILSAFKEASGQ